MDNIFCNSNHVDFNSIMGEILEEFFVNIAIFCIAIFIAPGFIYVKFINKVSFNEGHPWLISTIFWLIISTIIAIIYISLNTPEV